MQDSAVIIVEGLIGAGKSTFTAELGQALGSNTLVLMEPDEQDNANPYLADFYQDTPRWSFTMQVHLLGMRYRMQLAAQWHAMSGRGFAICDRSFYGDTCFARMMNKSGEIGDREFRTYRILYQAMTASVLLPAVCVRLEVSPDTAAERIRRRAEERTGRKCELSISLEYLRRLDEEINRTVDVLSDQGVQIITAPWDTDMGSPEQRLSDILSVADTIRCVTACDLLDAHHKRRAISP